MGEKRAWLVIGVIGFIAFFWGLSGLPIVIVDPQGTGFIPYAIGFVVGGILLFISARMMRK